jgi:hypothetical protein
LLIFDLKANGGVNTTGSDFTARAEEIMKNQVGKYCLVERNVLYCGSYY